MAQYLLKMIQPVGIVPDAADLAPVMEELGRCQQELQAKGSWVFGNGLTQPDAATVVRATDSGVSITDGPYSEGKEFLGGVTIIDVPDLDEALSWASRYATATGLPIEVAPFASFG